jgi:pimeloyl-ACP methyl ester carboxylesterase
MLGLSRLTIQIIANAGHAPFWDDAAVFNQRLRDFSASL